MAKSCLFGDLERRKIKDQIVGKYCSVYLEAETALTMQEDLDTANKVTKCNNNKKKKKKKGAEAQKQSGF